jgi:hypothetical protein
MLFSASSLASDRQMPTTPCLAAVYGPRNGRPLMPAVELVAMIDPPPLASRCGIETNSVFQTPVRLVSIVSRQSHLVPGLDGADARVGADDVELAELGDARVDRLLERAQVAHVGLAGDDPPVKRLDRLDRLGQVGFGAHAIAHGVVVGEDVDRDDVGALLGQPDRVTAALTAARAGDEGDLALYSSWHGYSSLAGGYFPVHGTRDAVYGTECLMIPILMSADDRSNQRDARHSC